MNAAPFQIFNASAGSGKTFTLVKRYLSILLGSSNRDAFKQVLAVTFTNKAVNEMKERVLKNLHEFSSEEILNNPTDIFSLIAEEIGVSPKELHERSKAVLTRILHNYAFFDIVTIDKFNHRLLRTFAFDLKLPTNFEVSLDEEALYNEAVDNLIYQAGEDPLLTEVLLNFALEKTDDDKSWDIARDLREIAKLLSKEEYLEHVKFLGDKSLEDFKELGILLKKMSRQQEEALVENAQGLLDLFSEKGLERLDFNSGRLPDRLKKIAEKSFSHNWSAGWVENIDSKPLYAGKVPKNNPATAALLDELQPKIASEFIKIKEGVIQLEFLKNFYKNLVPLSLLSAINSEVKKIKEDRNQLLISDFNRLISSAIAKQPAPFIYERIGEKYKNYFIDEFQDTSTMQWENMQPLVSNALETEISSGKTGTLLIVGDAKQAIYRWRGGKAEQFIELYNQNSPFQTQPHVEPLPRNFRSCDEIVEFNNRFFAHVSQFLNNETYRDLFKNHSHQQTNEKQGGYIDFTFIDKAENKESEEDLYCKAALETVISSIKNGYSYGDICILTRAKKQGIKIADYFSEHEIPIISSESLLLKNDKKVAFLIDLLSYFVQPDDLEVQWKILRFLADEKQVEDYDTFFRKFLNNMDFLFLEENFHSAYFLELPFYNAMEYAINSFNLAGTSEAALEFFLDEVLDFTQQQNGSIQSFLSHWDHKKDSLSIVAPSSLDAVQIMTVHKSKGLEFPVVIFPYADTDIYREMNFQIWFPVDKDLFGIDYALFSSKNVVSNSSETGKLLIEAHEQKQELDQINILYVALTRAAEQLYIISKKDIKANGVENEKTFSGMFIGFLKEEGKWTDTENHYSFGNPKRQVVKNTKKTTVSKSLPFISNTSFGQSFQLVTKAGSLWGSKQQMAIDKGNVYHHLLASIYTEDDIANVIENAINNGLISSEEESTYSGYLQNLVTHPGLKEYFSEDYEVFNEREIITAEGILLRPDRFVVKGEEAVIIDYKTGTPSENHAFQIQRYAQALTEMGYQVKKRILVYINENIQLIDA
ncbi:UvrD-helicase domain-containing protein [Galbibacter mesophilus]|uniref:UvrD-helicase domain-containing protein n=1 Tax=Galbibacter mesophilus TaxID=379069 RepID=UPI00191E5E18|nr:UvrD-helicase domain-containing protein [Galbibacter mesophilus]MCM5662107.1 UvrD-helicase domain-containing protein [Galbibacter mesophilus]